MSKPFLIGSHWIRQNQEKRVQRKPLPSDNNAYCEKWWLVWLYYWWFHTQYNCTSIFFSIYRNMYVEYKVEIQIREKWGRRRKAPSKGPTPCPLKRPQDVIFIFLHCTNSFLLSLTHSPSYFFPKLHIQPSIAITIYIYRSQ